MLYNIIAAVVGGLALLVILFILSKKFSRLKTIDVNTISEEKEAQVKERILLQRMKRHAQKGKKAFGSVVSPSGSKIKSLFGGIFRKVVELEKKYQRESKGDNVKDKNSEETVKYLIKEAEECQKKSKTADAEKKYIEAIGSDSKCLEAYDGLFDIYMSQKEFQQALQTQLYILKLHKKESKTVTKKNDVGQEQKSVSNAIVLNADYLHIGEVYHLMEDNVKAFEYFEKAIGMIPNDPKTIDLLISCSIDLSDKSKAVEYFKRLSEVNPENQKLIEYKKKIEEM